jgi:hypothetical protein
MLMWHKVYINMYYLDMNCENMDLVNILLYLNLY